MRSPDTIPNEPWYQLSHTRLNLYGLPTARRSNRGCFARSASSRLVVDGSKSRDEDVSGLVGTARGTVVRLEMQADGARDTPRL